MRHRFSPDLSKGFTIVELLVVIGIISTLFALATVNLVKTQHHATVSAATDQLVSDMRVQQMKAMAGIKDTTGSANSYGIHFLATGYKLFQGTSDPGDSTDFPVNPDGITISNTLAVAANNSLVFTQRTGEISGFSSSNNTITLKNANGTEQKTITFNKYGVVKSIQSVQ